MPDDDRPSPAELRAPMVTLLSGATGLSDARWNTALGSLQPLNLTFDSRSNWTVEASGSPDDQRAFEDAVDVVRQARPHVR